jgi:type II secretory pathway component PulF
MEDLDGESRIMHRLYVGLLLVALLAISVYMLDRVVPKFREIFKDFRTDLPPLTEGVLSIADFVGFGIEPYVVYGFVSFVVLCLCASLLRRWIAPGWPPLISYRWLREHAFERLPFVGPMRENRELADICQSLADFTRQGRTFDEALGAVRRLTCSTRLENRLSEWHQRVLAGEDIAEAARNARIPPTLVGFLRTFRGGGNELSTLLEFLATYYRMKFSRSVLVLRAVSEPALTLIAGVVVGTFVVALILPLVKLIQSVSGYSPGAL